MSENEQKNTKKSVSPKTEVPENTAKKLKNDEDILELEKPGMMIPVNTGTIGIFAVAIIVIIGISIRISTHSVSTSPTQAISRKNDSKTLEDKLKKTERVLKTALKELELEKNDVSNRTDQITLLRSELENKKKQIKLLQQDALNKKEHIKLLRSDLKNKEKEIQLIKGK